MKKKGFTLVELLAVIAILAILVIIALPNVLEMYRQARMNSFENEIKEIYRQAQQQYLMVSMGSNFGGGSKLFFKTGGDNTKDGSTMANAKKLDMQGGSGIKYCVELDSTGAVKELRVSNGTYLYEYNGDIIDASMINTGKDATGSKDSELAKTNVIKSPAEKTEVLSDGHICTDN